MESQLCGFGVTTGRTRFGKASASGAGGNSHILTPWAVTGRSDMPSPGLAATDDDALLRIDGATSVEADDTPPCSVRSPSARSRRAGHLSFQDGKACQVALKRLPIPLSLVLGRRLADIGDRILARRAKRLKIPLGLPQRFRVRAAFIVRIAVLEIVILPKAN